MIVNGIANSAGLKAEQLSIWMATGSMSGKLLTGGRKVVKQGINSVADKAKKMFYSDEDE